jgi:hypothetical protein
MLFIFNFSTVIFHLSSLTFPQVFIANAAAKAVALIAVLLLQLYQGLRVASRVHLQAAGLPHANDVVVLCLQLLEEVESTVAVFLVLTMTTHSEEHGDGRVDDEQIGR